jgi:phytoene dehydrogenase-like protein
VDADVIVVGGGHNGLICAAYLARAGIDTLVVEARDDVGGCASTVSDLGARFNICNCDHTMIRATPVASELDLVDHGLRYLESELTTIHQFHDRSAPWVSFHEVERQLDALAATHPTQVGGYRRYLADALPVAELIVEMARTKPSAARMLRGVAARRAAGAARLMQWSRRSVHDVMREYFDDWHLRVPGISIGPTVWGAPPEAPRTGTAAAIYATRHVVKSGRPAGGSGALTDAVRSSFEAAGGAVRCHSRVDRLLFIDGSVAGVRLVDGTDLVADVVVAACDPQRVLVDWVDDPPPAARRLVDRWRARPVRDGYESKIDAVITGLPEYHATEFLETVAPGADFVGPTTIISPSPDELASAHALKQEGRVASRPTMLANVPSVPDPSMRTTAGEHVLSLEVLFTPYALPGGWANSDEPARWLELYEGFLRPDSLQVDRWRVMTPDRYEAEFSLHRGNTPSYVASPLVALFGRHRETTRYRTPIAGLYLCGAGTFPGAGIFGASGRNAADVVERDIRGHGRGAGQRRSLPARLKRRAA